MRIQLNGDERDVPDGLTIQQLLDELGIDARRVAVEHNLTIVKRPRYETTPLSEGDKVEIVNFVGGG